VFSQVHIIAVWKRIFWVSFTFRSKYIHENYIWYCLCSSLFKKAI